MGYESITFDYNDVFLVTGGAGFIGSNLCEAVLKKGCRVRCLDNLSTGRLRNIDVLINHPDFTFIHGDIRDYETCKKACEGVDYVLHQAALGSVPRSISEPLLYEEVNIKGTLNMMEAARVNKVRKFIYASSSAVYGDDPSLPKMEGKEGNPISPYAITKLANEKYGFLYHMLYGLDTYGLRYFNVFGKRQDPEGAYAAVIPKFVSLLLKDETPVIYGDGMQSRDFTYIENVIEANIKACKAKDDAAGQVYNIACGGRKYLIDVYKLLCKMLNKDIEPIFGPERAGDIRHSYADISKAKEALGYAPEWSFERGMEEAIAWYKENLS